MCDEQMRLIAFVTDGTQIRNILNHIGLESQPAHIFAARGPPLWEDCGDTWVGKGLRASRALAWAAKPDRGLRGRSPRQLVTD